MKTEYNQGYEDYCNGYTYRQCPYFFLLQYYAWASGWLDAEEDADNEPYDGYDYDRYY